MITSPYNINLLKMFSYNTQKMASFDVSHIFINDNLFFAHIHDSHGPPHAIRVRYALIQFLDASLCFSVV